MKRLLPLLLLCSYTRVVYDMDINIKSKEENEYD